MTALRLVYSFAASFGASTASSVTTKTAILVELSSFLLQL
jgi:hypothetical protein